MNVVVIVNVQAHITYCVYVRLANGSAELMWKVESIAEPSKHLLSLSCKASEDLLAIRGLELVHADWLNSTVDVIVRVEVVEGEVH